VNGNDASCEIHQYNVYVVGPLELKKIESDYHTIRPAEFSASVVQM